MESVHTDRMLGQFLRQDIAEHVLHGPELTFDGDVMIGLPFCSQTSRDSTSEDLTVALESTDGEVNAIMTPVLWKMTGSEVDQ